VRKSVEDAASLSGTLWLSYLFALFHIGIAAGAVTHKDLLLENAVKLPFLNVELPLVAFFALAPILFVISHAYTLMHFVLLAAKAGTFNAELGKKIPDPDGAPTEDISPGRAAELRETRFGLRRQLPSNIFVQFLAGPRDIRDGGLGCLLKAVAWISLVIGPVLLLLLIQVQFLPYHLWWVTWVQRFAILADVILLWALWPAVLESRSEIKWPPIWRHPVLTLASLVPIGLAFTAATFPGEGLDEWIGKRQWIPPSPSAKWSDQKDWMSFLTTWYGQEGWTSFHDVLFNGDVDDVTRRRKSLFSNTLVLPTFDALEAAKIDDPKKLDTVKHTLILRGRHLESAVFYSADLRKADLEGAHLQGAQLKGASLQAAQLQGASLQAAQLQGASLRDAKLEGASLLDAKLEGALLDRADLHGAMSSALWHVLHDYRLEVGKFVLRKCAFFHAIL
jgi:Pentapeptide repeats (8 copies)